ncbi:DUF871 domain-containing protein [Cetobacterium sp. 8H]|uniref:DUF871 domain-containing protein n=1 Tax=Cetobacterium sp. 8H TaxID=2759681 RepID=UPI00163B957C|nr:MupG family TIM beta-alpha barrel fold protein [Cetobacterium sp. 8H]MBC2850997.1 DUF871 domain-containing protein [Cetobacterium sp. 8H]
MRELGISIYPFHATLDENKNYIEMAAKYGYKRVFTCLLSVEGDKNAIVNEFKETIAYANRFGMQVMVDVAPSIFSKLGISYEDLSFFKEIGAYGVRLDLGFSGNEESIMTFNEHGLVVEINMSQDTNYVNTIMDYMPNREKLVGCHNFYPHRYTGLSREHFRNCNKRFKGFSLTTAAFVTAQTGTFGPWPVNDGLCTLEEHRDLPIEVQGRELFNEGIDVVIISNCFPTEDELKALAGINKEMLELECEVYEGVGEVERAIIEKELHFQRGDVGEYVVRSTQSRVKYKGTHFELFNPSDIKKGDVLIESSLYGQYAGELHIARKDMKNGGKTSVVGKIKPEYMGLLDSIKPWQKFKVKIK